MQTRRWAGIAVAILIIVACTAGILSMVNSSRNMVVEAVIGRAVAFLCFVCATIIISIKGGLWKNDKKNKKN